MQQRADGTWDRSDSTIYIREDFSLDKILALVEKMEKSQNKLGAGFQKYFNQSASGKADIAFANVFKQYVPYLKSLQGKKASQLSKDEINNLKTFTLLLDKQFRVLSKTMTSQDKLRDAEFASTMRKFWRDFALAQNDVYTQPYKRNAEVLGGVLGGFNGKNSNFSKILDLMKEYKSSGTKTWSEHVDDLSKVFEKVGVTTNIAPLVGNVPKLLEAYSRIEAYRKYKSSKMPYDAQPMADFSGLSFPSSASKILSDMQKEYLENAITFFDNFSVSRLLNGLNVITKDLPAIHNILRISADATNSFISGAGIGKMFSEAFGFEDKGGKLGNLLNGAAGAIGGAIGGYFGGPAGAVAGKVAGSQLMKLMSDKLGGPLAMIGGMVGAIVSILGAIWKMLKKSSPILQAVGDLFNLAMTLFFLPFGNAIGKIFLPLLETLVEFAIVFNDVVSSYLDPIADAISNQLYEVFNVSLTVLKAIAPYIADIAGFFGDIAAFIVTAQMTLLTWTAQMWPTIIKAATMLLDYFTSGEFSKMFGNLVTNLIPLVIKTVSDILAVLPAIIEFVSDLVTNLIPLVIKTVSDILDALPKIIVFVSDLVTNKIPDILAKITDILDAVAPISDTLKNISEILSIFKNVGGTVVGGDFGEKASTGLKSGWDFFKGGGLVGWGLRQLGITPLATGGIVTSPTLSLIGERRPEAVVPLDESGFGATYNVYITGDVYGVSDLETRIEKAIQRTANKSYYR